MNASWGSVRRFRAAVLIAQAWQSRTLRVAIAMWFSRAFSLGVQFYFIRLCISQLGAPVYAAMAMTLALQSWTALADLGLATALQQRVATFRDDSVRCRALMGHAWRTLGRAALILVPVAALAAYYIGGRYLAVVDGISLHDKRLGLALGVAGLVMVTIGQTAQRVLLGLGDGVRANLLLAVGTFLSVSAGLLGGHLWTSHRFAGLALGYCFSAALLWWWLLWKIPRAPKGASHYAEDIRGLNRLARDSWMFLALAATILSVDYLILSIVCVQAEVLLYNLANRTILPGFLVVSALFASYQPEASYALGRGERVAVLRGIHRIISIGAGVVAALLATIVLAEGVVLRWLAPGQNLSFGLPLIGLFLGYYLIRVWTDGFAVIIVAAGRVKDILPAVFVQALISAPLQYALGQHWGVHGVVAGLSLGFLFTVSWYIPRKAYELCTHPK